MFFIVVTIFYYTVWPRFCEHRLCENLDLMFNHLCTVGQAIWQIPCKMYSNLCICEFSILWTLFLIYREIHKTEARLYLKWLVVILKGKFTHTLCVILCPSRKRTLFIFYWLGGSAARARVNHWISLCF